MGKNRHYRSGRRRAFAAPSAAPALPARALPRRLRAARLLIVGCGDVGGRLVQMLQERLAGRIRIMATTREAGRAARLRAAGAVPLAIDLDYPTAARRLRGLATWVVDLAPPPAHGADDPRTRNLLAALTSAGRRPTRFVYLSTTGVYGDCAGARFDETRPVAPASARASRRVAAERRLRRARLPQLAILRAPGIYDSAARLPVARLRRGTPALSHVDDVHTNHIHADDLAAACLAALYRGRPNRVYHAVDDSETKMGDYFDQVADALALPRPPRLSRADIERVVSPELLSFMSESRRLSNHRLRTELRLRLRYPQVADGLREAVALVQSKASPESSVNASREPPV